MIQATSYTWAVCSLHDPITCKGSYNNTWGLLREERRERGREEERGGRQRKGEREMRCVIMYRGEKRERSGRDLFLHSLSPSLSLPCQREGECDDVEREGEKREKGQRYCIRALALGCAHYRSAVSVMTGRAPIYATVLHCIDEHARLTQDTMYL